MRVQVHASTNARLSLVEEVVIISLDEFHFKKWNQPREIITTEHSVYRRNLIILNLGTCISSQLELPTLDNSVVHAWCIQNLPVRPETCNENISLQVSAYDTLQHWHKVTQSFRYKHLSITCLYWHFCLVYAQRFIILLPYS